MSEPLTATGRKHLQWLLAGDDVYEDDARATVLAIEAEAAREGQGLDVERLARALHAGDCVPNGLGLHEAGSPDAYCTLIAPAVAREYAAAQQREGAGEEDRT